MVPYHPTCLKIKLKFQYILCNLATAHTDFSRTRCILDHRASSVMMVLILVFASCCSLKAFELISVDCSSPAFSNVYLDLNPPNLLVQVYS